MMKPIGAACEEKRKSRTVSTFLKKTYELLNVPFHPSRTASIKILFDGPHPGSALSSQTKNYLQKLSFPSISSTLTTHLSCDK